MTTRQIYGSHAAWAALAEGPRDTSMSSGITIRSDLRQPAGGDIRNGWLAMLTCAHGGAGRRPSCCVTAAIVTLLMLAGLRTSTDKTVKPWTERETAWFHVGERVTFTFKETKCPGLRNTLTRWQVELLFSSRHKVWMINWLLIMAWLFLCFVFVFAVKY